MAKHLNVSLGFTADTSQAKAQLKTLQADLDNLIKNPGYKFNLGIDKELKNASIAAATLRTQLQDATNVKTGKLDLGVFNESLKRSKYTLEDYKNSLMELGPEGGKIFAQLSQSIMNAEMPLKRSNALLQEFGNTLKNTVRWQLSSSMLHGFMGSMQGAYNYAQDLNKSLNDIRIVTGQSVDQMADFAEKANESAKALSTTTTAYTDAALIFYQQGLTGDAVKERTDTVMKMSNVTGETAADVSSYMTAVWNNFDDGSKSIEHYADVMTALGAATASSTEEIAGGLEKFASIGNTVGLSYEYATTALATVVSQTRQSEDTVGTAFKTLFARIQDLELGKILEDGTDLGKYSQALATIGVNIKDATGQIKDMDTILDELGSKWGTLSKDVQIATAQTVAGTRQYSQLLALMDNWDVFQQNLRVANTADGALQEQAEIYAESWEAARKRVKASAQDIFDSLLNDQFFIDFNNMFAGFLDTIGGVIDGLGGMKGVLLSIGTIFLRVYKDQAATALENLGYNLMSITQKGREAAISIKKEANNALYNMFADTVDPNSELVGNTYASQAKVQNTLIDNADRLTEQQRTIAQILLDQHNTLVEEVVEQSKIADKAEKTAKAVAQTQRVKAENALGENATEEDKVAVNKKLRNYQTKTKQAAAFDTVITEQFSDSEDVDKLKARMDGLIKSFDKNAKSVKEVDVAIEEAFGEEGAAAIEEFYQALQKPEAKLKDIQQSLNQLFDKKFNLDSIAGDAENELPSNVISTEDTEKIRAAGVAIGETRNKTIEATVNAEHFKEKIDSLPESTNRGALSFVELGQALSTTAMLFSSFSGLMDTWKGVAEGTIDTGDALVQTISTLGFVLPMVISSYTSLKAAGFGVHLTNLLLDGSTKLLTLSESGLISAKLADKAATIALTMSYWSLLGVLAAVVAAIGVVVGVIWGLVKVVQFFISQTPENKLKALEEEADNAAAAFSKVTEEVDTLRNSLESIDDSYEKLSKMKKGTQEWAEEVEKINTEILELLDLYPQIADSIHSQDGVLYLDEKGYETLNDIANSKYQNAENYKIGTQVNALNQKAKNASSSITDGAPLNTIKNYFTGADFVDKYLSYGESLFADKEVQNKAITEMINTISSSNIDNKKIAEDIKKILETKQEDIVNAGSVKKSAEVQKNLQIDEILQGLGSNRTAKESSELFGGEDLYEILMEKAEEKFSVGNFDSTKITKKDSKEYNQVKGIESQIGDGSYEFTGKENWLGKLKFENEEGDVITKTYKEIIDMLSQSELPIEDMQQEIVEKMREGLSNTLDRSFANIPSDKIIDLDNIKNNLTGLFSDIGTNESDTQELTKTIMNSNLLKDGEGNFDSVKVEDFSNDFNNIDRTNPEDLERLNEAALKLKNEGAAGIEEFAKTVRELGASGEIKQMTDDFKQAAESMGLKEEEAETMQGYAEHLMEVSKESETFSEEIAENAEVAKDLSIQITKMDKGINSLADGYKDWADILKNSTKESKEYYEAMEDMKSSLSDILDVEKDFISNDFVTENLDNIKLAAEGNEEAINALHVALARDLVVNIVGAESFDALDIELQDRLNALQEMVNSSDIKVGATIDMDQMDASEAEFLAACQGIVDQAGMTADQATQFFSAMGFDVSFETVPQPVERTGHEVITTTKVEEMAEVSNPDGKGTYKYPSRMSTQTTQGAAYNYTEYVDAPAMRASEPGKPATPVIKSLRRKAGGGQSNFSSANKGGKGPGKASKGGGGGGKGGGGGSSKKKKVEKPKETELDPYREVNRSIAKVKKSLDTLDKEKSHLFGKELILNIQKENKLLQEQYKNYEALGGVINSELSRIKSELSGFNYGTGFDSTTGEILNYAQAYNKALQAYNDAVSRYNASAQEEADEEALKQAEERYSKFVKLLEDYDKTLDKRMENEQTKLETQYKIIENNYKAWETEIEVTMDLGEAKREWKKFWQEADKDFKNVYEDFGKELANITDNFDLFNKTQFATNLGAVQSIKKELDKIKAGGKSDRYASESEAANDLLKYSNALKDDAEELYNLYSESWDTYLNHIDQIVDKWDEVIDEFDSINDSLEHNAQIIELLYGEGDFAKEMNGKVMEAQKQNNLAMMNSLRIAQASLQAEREQLLAQGAKETDEDVVKLTEAIKNNQQQLESAIESYLEGLTNQFQNAVEIAMKKMEKAMTGGSTFDKISERWEDAKYASQGYYDQVEKVYQLETMQNKWETAIQNTSSIKNQQKLKDLMEAQMQALEGKNKLSEYDIQLAEKQFAIAQAQIALEEAQNNKTSMKLTRGADGNWSYQYVADDEDVASKQQALMDANNEWYQFTKTSWEEMTEEIMGDIQAAQERLTELMMEYNTADEARREEIKEEYDYLYDYYFGEEGLIASKTQEAAERQDELNKATMGTLWELYLQDEENYKNMTENEQALMDALRENGVNSYEMLKDFVAGNGGVYDQMKDKIIDVNNESLSSWQTMAKDVIDRWHKDPDSVSKEVDAAYQEIVNAQKEYDKAVQEGVAASGVEFDKIGGPGGSLDKILSQTDKVIAKTDELGKQTAGIDDMRKHVEGLKGAWESVRDSIQGAIYDLEYYLSALTGGQYESGYQGSDTSGTGGGSGSGSGGGSNGDGVLAIGDTATFSGSYYYTSAGASPTGSLYSGVANGVVVDAINDNEYGVHIHSADGAYGDLGWVKRSQISGFDTGGFTGDWGSGTGRLALLHSKELVLNKDDTTNILNAVEAVRSISSIGSSIANSISNGISNMVKNMLNLKAVDYTGAINTDESENISNTFEVTMNVDGGDVNEIKEAILNLPTLASQYLSKKNK